MYLRVRTCTHAAMSNALRCRTNLWCRLCNHTLPPTLTQLCFQCGWHDKFMLEPHYNKAYKDYYCLERRKTRCMVDCQYHTSTCRQVLPLMHRFSLVSRVLQGPPFSVHGERSITKYESWPRREGGRISKVVATRACTCTLLSKLKKVSGMHVSLSPINN